jgi:hypothetical protein
MGEQIQGLVREIIKIAMKPVKIVIICLSMLRDIYNDLIQSTVLPY